MTPDSEFARVAASLFEPGMGTEHVAPLLHSIVRMTRPRRVLEVGLGYTSLFLLDALAKAKQDHEEDRRAVREGRRRNILNDRIVEADYNPLLLAIDDFSLPESGCARVAAAANGLGLSPLLKLLPGDFRDVVPTIAAEDLPLDMIWFDCGGAPEYVTALSMLWPRLSSSYGLFGLHFTYWGRSAQPPGKPAVTFMVPGDILDEIKRQQGALGLEARFEVLSLLEPHKTRQGSITLIRKLPPQDRIREHKDENSFDLRKG